MTPASSLLPENSLALRTSHLIGRENLVKALRTAISDTTGKSQALYFIGVGGIGKTRLLEEVNVILKDWQGQSTRCTPIIDLYHSEHHSPSGLRKSIINELDPDNEFFQLYWETLEVYREKRAAQAPNAILEPLRQELDRQFKEAYTRLAKQYRIVIRFDTFELVQHESDQVQRLCQVDDADTAIKTWFLQQVSLLPNTVVLFAGRPQPEGQPQIIDDIELKFVDAGYNFQKLKLVALEQEETKLYLEDLRRQRPTDLSDMLTPKNVDRLYDITGGRPIYLALLVDLALQPGQGDFLENWPTDEQNLRRRLVEMLQSMLPEPLAEIIHFLVFARKGLDYDLLTFLVHDKWTKEKTEESLRQIKGLAIVKSRELATRSRTDDTDGMGEPSVQQMQFFLHDEVYDIFDEYYADPKHRLGSEFAEIARYYRAQSVPPSFDGSYEDWQINRLYYELQVDPYIGYFHYYVRWDEEAIWGQEIDFDMRLRDEVLRFINRYMHPGTLLWTERVASKLDRNEVERDAAVRWVKRYVARSKTKLADQIAETIRHSTAPSFDWDSVHDPLYKASLLTAWSEALLYIADDEKRKQAHSILEEAVHLLETHRQWDENKHWIWARTLGRAHNNIGYLYRTEGRYGLARQQYQRALPYFTEIDVSSEEANTRTNLAFVLATLGRLPAARKHAEQALYTRQLEGKRYPIALSQNTLGLIYTLEDHPDWGERECSAALKFFEGFNVARGIGLAYNGLGLALRQRGNHWKLGEAVYSIADAEQSFKQGAEYLTKAVQIFSEVAEPLRLWEAYNELGSLYCDWGWLARQSESGRPAALTLCTTSAQYQEAAVRVAENYNFQFQLADALDDLAQVVGDQSFLMLSMGQYAEARSSRARAEENLDRVEKMVPQAFKLAPGKGFGATSEFGEAYWLSLGKVHFWRGVWIFRDLAANISAKEERAAKSEAAINELIEAIAYFQRYDEFRSYLRQRSISYITDFIQQQRVSISQVRGQIDAFTHRYSLDLKVLYEAIDDMLGT